jgi:hypothetical protein
MERLTEACLQGDTIAQRRNLQSDMLPLSLLVNKLRMNQAKIFQATNKLDGITFR